MEGPVDLIDETRYWQRRHGGNLHTVMGELVVGCDGPGRPVGEDARLRERAFELAAVLADLDGVTINPDPPQVDVFHHPHRRLTGRTRARRPEHETI